MKKKSLKTIAVLIFLIPLIIIYSCNKNISAINPVRTSGSLTDTTLSDTSIFIDITLDGTRFFEIKNNAWNTWADDWNGYQADSLTYIYNRIGSSYSAGANDSALMFGFSKGTVTGFLPSTFINPKIFPKNFIDSFFASGNYNYSLKSNDTTLTYLGMPGDTISTGKTDTIFSFNPTTFTQLTNGISLMWVDSTGRFWDTFKGSADQTGSYFIITKNEPQTEPEGSFWLCTVVTASFDCKLYDDYGHVMHLTKGRMRLICNY